MKYDKEQLEKYFELFRLWYNDHKSPKETELTKKKISVFISTIKEPEEKQCMSCEKIISKNEVFVFCEDCSGYKDHVKTKLITDIDIKHDKEIDKKTYKFCENCGSCKIENISQLAMHRCEECSHIKTKL